MTQTPVDKDEGDDPGSDTEDAYADNVPITDGCVRTTFRGKDDDGVSAAVIEQHCKAFME